MSLMRPQVTLLVFGTGFSILLPTLSQLLRNEFCAHHCAEHSSNYFCSFCFVPRASTLHLVPVWPPSARLKSHALSWLLGGTWHTLGMPVAFTNLTISSCIFFLLQQLLQGSTWPVSGYGHRPSPFAENCLITGYLKPMFCLVCFTSSQCVNTALSRTKQTFVASLPSDFWSLGHFSLAINKAQYQLSTIASLIMGFKVLT